MALDQFSLLAKKIPLIILILGFFTFQNLSANDEPVPIFELKDSFMGQPKYIIKIYKDGKVHYTGYTYTVRGKLTQSVAVIGDRYAELTQSQLNELILYFLSLPFEISKKYEIKRRYEIWAKVIDYRDTYASIHLNDPVIFSVLIKKLDKFINIRPWVCLPQNSPNFNDSCIQDNLPDNIDDLKYYLER